MNMLKADRLLKRLPLDEDRPFLSEKEEICLRLLLIDQASLADMPAEKLVELTAGQIGPERAQTVCTIAKMARLPGIGTWFARLAVEAGLDIQAIRTLPAEEIVAIINAHMGYPVCDAHTANKLKKLRDQWG